MVERLNDIFIRAALSFVKCIAFTVLDIWTVYRKCVYFIFFSYLCDEMWFT